MLSMNDEGCGDRIEKVKREVKIWKEGIVEGWFDWIKVNRNDTGMIDVCCNGYWIVLE